MHIDVNVRARAARTLLDAVSSLDPEDHGTDQADERTLLALEQLGLPRLDDASPELAATMAAATDLLFALTLSLSQWRGEDREVTISNLREQVLPAVYPDADPA